MTRRRGARTTKAPQPARDLNRTARILAAQQLRREGYEWQEIADTLGIKGGKGAAYNLVNNALIQALREGDEAMRELENQRLDALHKVYYPKALDGDGWSHDRVLAQMERRASLNGLDKPKAEVAPREPLVVEVPAVLAQALRLTAAPLDVPDEDDAREEADEQEGRDA